MQYLDHVVDGQIGITWKEERTYEPPSE